MAQDELLTVTGFAGIKTARLRLARLTILIGPQASGKSICSRLFFFARQIVNTIPGHVRQDLTKDAMVGEYRKRFLTYFPAECWGNSQFAVEYSYGPFSLRVTRADNNSSAVDVEFSAYFDELVEIAKKAYKEEMETAFALELKSMDSYGGPRPVPSLINSIAERVRSDGALRLAHSSHYIPAGRSVYAFIGESIFTLIASGATLDPFIVEFGKLYERLRNAYGINWNEQNRITSLLSGNYVPNKPNDYIETTDGRRVPVNLCSSGQQEALPIAITLSQIRDGLRGLSFVVEEPEAHLFPSTQRSMMHFLAATAKLNSKRGETQFLITTHSPYILSAINNLMYAGKIANETTSKLKDIRGVIGDTEVIDPAHVTAYLMQENSVRSIIDPSTGLIEGTLLDEVSGELAREFGKLMDIEFEEAPE
jgi:hypothetical protein